MYQPKHITDGSPGKFMLRWNGVEVEPGRYRYIYYGQFHSREDAMEYYENLVKPFWSANMKWEIVDQSLRTPSTH